MSLAALPEAWRNVPTLRGRHGVLRDAVAFPILSHEWPAVGYTLATGWNASARNGTHEP